MRQCDPNRFSDNQNSKWNTCHLCGPVYVQVMLNFDSGSITPVEDEVLTGATSGDTGVVEDIVLLSGAWANGDAAGFVMLSSPTGYDAIDLLAFEDDELIAGSTGGANMFTANGDGYVQKSGLMYPEQELIEYEGRLYCPKCFQFHTRHKLMDEMVLEPGEQERGR